MKKLKVFAWETESATRWIVAARSKHAALAWLRLILGPTSTKDIVETTEEVAVVTAMAEPGVLFFRPTQRPDGTHYVRIGETWLPKPLGPVWSAEWSGVSRAELDGGVTLLSCWGTSRTSSGYNASVELADVSFSAEPPEPSMAAGRRAAESVARKVIGEQIAKLQRSLDVLGPEPTEERSEGT